MLYCKGKGRELRKESSGSKIEIRKLRIKDYGRMLEVWKSAGLAFKPKGRESRISISKQMKETPELFLGAFREDTLVGVIVGSSEGKRKGWLNRIAVLPQMRGQGIAKKLTWAAEKELKKMGIGIIGLLIEKSNKTSIKLAKSLGYKVHTNILYLTKRESEDV